MTALTDLGGSVVERYVYTPYGEVTVHQDTSYGDRDGDGDVDSTDKGTVGVTCTGTVSGACRVNDLDFDGDYDSTDATKFESLTQGTGRHPGKTSTGVDQPFAHQGLLFEPELASYQNRARQYDPGKRRFFQTDPLVRDNPRSGYRDGLNSYHYVQGNPTRAVDPNGTWATVTDYPNGPGFPHVNVHLKIVFWGFGVAGPNPHYEDDLQAWNVPAANGLWVYKGNLANKKYPPSGQGCRPVNFTFEAFYVPSTIAGLESCNSYGSPPGDPAAAFSMEPWSTCFGSTLDAFGADVSVWVAPPACAPNGKCGDGQFPPNGGTENEEIGSDKLWINYDFMFNYIPNSHGLSHEMGHVYGLLSYQSGAPGPHVVPRPPGLIAPMMQSGIVPRNVAHIEMRDVLRNTPPFGNWNMCIGQQQ